MWSKNSTLLIYWQYTNNKRQKQCLLSDKNNIFRVLYIAFRTESWTKNLQDIVNTADTLIYNKHLKSDQSSQLNKLFNSTTNWNNIRWIKTCTTYLSKCLALASASLTRSNAASITSPVVEKERETPGHWLGLVLHMAIFISTLLSIFCIKWCKIWVVTNLFQVLQLSTTPYRPRKRSKVLILCAEKSKQNTVESGSMKVQEGQNCTWAEKWGEAIVPLLGEGAGSPSNTM